MIFQVNFSWRSKVIFSKGSGSGSNILEESFEISTSSATLKVETTTTASSQTSIPMPENNKAISTKTFEEKSEFDPDREDSENRSDELSRSYRQNDNTKGLLNYHLFNIIILRHKHFL